MAALPLASAQHGARVVRSVGSGVEYGPQPASFRYCKKWWRQRAMAVRQTQLSGSTQGRGRRAGRSQPSCARRWHQQPATPVPSAPALRPPRCRRTVRLQARSAPLGSPPAHDPARAPPECMALGAPHHPRVSALRFSRGSARRRLRPKRGGVEWQMVGGARGTSSRASVACPPGRTARHPCLPHPNHRGGQGSLLPPLLAGGLTVTLTSSLPSPMMLRAPAARGVGGTTAWGGAGGSTGGLQGPSSGKHVLQAEGGRQSACSLVDPL